MRKCTVYARFFSFFRVVKVAAALFAGKIKRTKTEKAVEVFRVVRFVAREIFAVSVAEKAGTVLHV